MGKAARGFGLRITQARRAKGWTQLRLHQATQASTVSVSAWENEKTAPHWASFSRLAEALDVSADWLKYGDGDPKIATVISYPSGRNPDLACVTVEALVMELDWRGFAVSLQPK